MVDRERPQVLPVMLDLTAEQELLRTESLRFERQRCPLDRVRELADNRQFDRDYWRQAAELGWFAAMVPDSLGGGSVSGRGVLDAAIIGVERGRLLQPGPFVGTNVLAWALASDDTGRWTTLIESIVEGQQVATWACGCDRGVHQGEGEVELRIEDDVNRLYGCVTMVQDAETADWFLVTFQSVKGLRQVILSRESDGLTIEPLDGLDITRRFSTVTFAGVQLADLDFVGPDQPGTASFDRQSAVGTVLSLAENVGAMDEHFRLALEYARVRTAFGRPIGSFQSVKHALADTSLNLEISKALLSAAANAVQDDADDQHHVVAVAKSFVSEAVIGLSQMCFQVFAGIGFTWEHDQHLYYRRLAVDAQLYGSAERHRELLCAMNGL